MQRKPLKAAGRPALRLIDCTKQRAAPRVCHDTVAVCRSLLAMAQEGEITGLVFAVSGPNRRGDMGLIGSYEQNPEGLALVSVTLAEIARRRSLDDDSEA